MNTNRFRCPVCGTRRTNVVFMLKHQKEKDHKACECGGYHYPHTPRSRYCVQNPKVDYWIALRDGATEEQLFDPLLELAMNKSGLGGSNKCPF